MRLEMMNIEVLKEDFKAVIPSLFPVQSQWDPRRQNLEESRMAKRRDVSDLGTQGQRKAASFSKRFSKRRCSLNA